MTANLPHRPQGCNAVVFAAKWASQKARNQLSGNFDLIEDASEESSAPRRGGTGAAEHPLAVKMMFNYEAESNSFAIMNAMRKETVPARRVVFAAEGDSGTGVGGTNIIAAEGKRLPPHANIVDVEVAFADYVPDIMDAINHYPDALPRR